MEFGWLSPSNKWNFTAFTVYCISLCVSVCVQKQKLQRVKAIYDCFADNPDELTFFEGEVIVVEGEEDSEWWVSHSATWWHHCLTSFAGVCAQLWFLCVSARAHWRRAKQARSVSCHLRPLLHRLMSLPVSLSLARLRPRGHDDNRDWMLEIRQLVFVSFLMRATHTVP